MPMPTVTITTRSRNLGYGWSTDRAVEMPDHVGTVKAIRAAMVERARLLGPGTHYVERLFVGGVPVSERWSGYYREVINEVEITGSAEVALNPALRAGEIGGSLGVSRQTVLARFNAGDLPGAWAVGKRHEVRMYRDDVLTFLDRQTEAPDPDSPRP